MIKDMPEVFSLFFFRVPHAFFNHSLRSPTQNASSSLYPPPFPPRTQSRFSLVQNSALTHMYKNCNNTKQKQNTIAVVWF